MIVTGFTLVLLGVIGIVTGLHEGYIIIISGLLIMLIKVSLLFVREDKKKRKVTSDPDTSDPDPVRPADQKVIYSTVFKVTGVTFDCQKDNQESRQNIISGLKTRDLLILEEFEYKKEPAYLVVDYSSDLDIGTVPADLTEQLNDKFYGHTTIMEVVSVDSFIPDDSTEEIYFCKVKMEVLER